MRSNEPLSISTFFLWHVLLDILLVVIPRQINRIRRSDVIVKKIILILDNTKLLRWVESLTILIFEAFWKISVIFTLSLFLFFKPLLLSGIFVIHLTHWIWIKIRISIIYCAFHVTFEICCFVKVFSSTTWGLSTFSKRSSRLSWFSSELCACCHLTGSFRGIAIFSIELVHLSIQFSLKVIMVGAYWQISLHDVTECILKLFRSSEVIGLVLSDELNVEISMDKVILKILNVSLLHMRIQVGDEHILLHIFLNFVRVNFHFAMNLVDSCVAVFDEPLDCPGVFLHLIFYSAHNPIEKL